MNSISTNTWISIFLFIFGINSLDAQPDKYFYLDVQCISVGLKDDLQIIGCSIVPVAELSDSSGYYDHCLPVDCNADRTDKKSDEVLFVFVDEKLDTMELSIYNLRANADMPYLIKQIPFSKGTFNYTLRDPILQDNDLCNYSGIYPLLDYEYDITPESWEQLRKSERSCFLKSLFRRRSKRN